MLTPGVDGVVCDPGVEGLLVRSMELVGVRMITDVSVQLPTFPVSVVVEVITPVQPDVNVVT